MAEAALGDVELNWSLLSAEALESELEALGEEQRSVREVLLRLLLPYDGLTSPPGTQGSGFPHPHLPLLDVSGNALTVLVPELLPLSGLRMLLAGNNRLGGQGSLPRARCPRAWPSSRSASASRYVVVAQRQLLPGAACLAAGAA